MLCPAAAAGWVMWQWRWCDVVIVEVKAEMECREADMRSHGSGLARLVSKMRLKMQGNDMSTKNMAECPLSQ